MSAIRCRGLTAWHKGEQVLKGVDLLVEPGEVCLLLGAMLMYLIPNLVTAFTLVTTLSAVLFMFVWSLILCAYIAYRRKRPEQHVASAFKMPGGVLMCYVCLAFFAFVIVLLTLQPDTRQALLASPVWFLILAIGYRVKS